MPRLRAGHRNQTVGLTGHDFFNLLRRFGPKIQFFTPRKSRFVPRSRINSLLDLILFLPGANVPEFQDSVFPGRNQFAAAVSRENQPGNRLRMGGALKIFTGFKNSKFKILDTELKSYIILVW